MTFTCFDCGVNGMTQPEYEQHLLAQHPSTWLAKRVHREQERPEIKHSVSDFPFRASKQDRATTRAAASRRRRTR